MKSFDIPIAIFIFRRTDTVLRILERIETIQPGKIYLISDGPRNADERLEVEACRRTVESRINWGCEVVKNYADTNRGVYDRIGLGAKWVLSLEPYAIFLEDDNLPEVTFFEYCRQLLEKYRDDDRIFWICGTNYLEEYDPMDNASYVFTRHLLPCGWASWSHKFNRFYEGDMELFRDKDVIMKISHAYEDKRLFKQQLHSLRHDMEQLRSTGRPTSWDFQMAFSIRAHGLLGISPSRNQIENIGADQYSTHGGSSIENVMTARFCGIKSRPLEFPLVHPKIALPDKEYEKRVGRIILYPLSLRTKVKIAGVLRSLLGPKRFRSLTKTLRGAFRNERNYKSGTS